MKGCLYNTTWPQKKYSKKLNFILDTGVIQPMITYDMTNVSVYPPRTVKLDRQGRLCYIVGLTGKMAVQKVLQEIVISSAFLAVIMLHPRIAGRALCPKGNARALLFPTRADGVGRPPAVTFPQG